MDIQFISCLLMLYLVMQWEQYLEGKWWNYNRCYVQGGKSQISDPSFHVRKSRAGCLRPCRCWWFLPWPAAQKLLRTAGSDCSGRFSRAGQAFPGLRGVRKGGGGREEVEEGTPGGAADTVHAPPFLLPRFQPRQGDVFRDTSLGTRDRCLFFCFLSAKEKALRHLLTNVTEASRAATVWIPGCVLSCPPTP